MALFPLMVSHNIGHSILGWNADAHVDMVCVKMPFHNLRFPFFSQFREYSAEVSAQCALDLLLASLRDENNVVLAIPFGVA